MTLPTPSTARGPAVLISEVGPRDGLQSVRATMATRDKLRWIDALVEAGLSEIEVGSYVPARLLPQMADIDTVVAHALRHPGLKVAVLAPNLKGAQRALEAGVHKITLPISVSQAHSQANVRMSTEQAIEQLAAVCRLRDQAGIAVTIEAGLSTVFGCTIAGPVAQADVVRYARLSAQAGANEIGLADTTGYAVPSQVIDMFNAVGAAIGTDRLGGGAHLHNTRGLGLANAFAAWQAGVRVFDSSQGGLGGCPFAPGATGNIVTEDLVFMFEAMGVDTGIDLDRLAAARAILQAALPGEPVYGYLPAAGVTRGFVAARNRQVPA